MEALPLLRIVDDGDHAALGETVIHLTMVWAIMSADHAAPGNDHVPRKSFLGQVGALQCFMPEETFFSTECPVKLMIS
ncbi:MAG: hypothetical protein HY885_13605 [Deltaproteobacteria bacterium]|nr:hypothetical protein [Deltaproteobacteria bacterium]